jgi:hypothetical protein
LAKVEVIPPFHRDPVFDVGTIRKKSSDPSLQLKSEAIRQVAASYHDYMAKGNAV